MREEQTYTGRRVTSRVRRDGHVELTLADSRVGPPGPDEVVVRVEATPINPSDLGLLLAGADPASARPVRDASDPTTVLELPPGAGDNLGGRLEQALPVGNEGAGTVVAAGDGARDLLGRLVSCAGGGMWTEYRLVPAENCLVLEPGTPVRDAAAGFVNPMTVLALVETARRDGHTALVHTAAASNLGQMLLRACLADGIGLVAVVRSDEQADLLRSLGAEHVCDSSADDFTDQLRDAIAATGATVAFDAVGGGPLAGQILRAMEAVSRADAQAYSLYGSSVRKQVHVYGRLDPRPLEVDLSIGLAWQVGGWLLTNFLRELTPKDVGRMRTRVATELTTTFASTYGAEISLADVLSPEAIAGYARRGTGQKYLIAPHGPTRHA
jgi:NADPH:quinone reductase-like Zn-dependent oxidoreductase